MPVINGVYLKDFTALPSSVTDANIIPIAITGDQVAYRTTVAGIVTDARVTSKLLTGLSVTGSTISATDTILQAFGKVQNQLNGKVTSVGLTMPSAFSVANSPITSAGTLAVTAAGVASQYIRGDGALADFPTTGGGGSSVSYYLNGSVSQGTFVGNTYYEMNKTPVIGAGTDFTIGANGYIAQFITDANDPASLLIPGGNWNVEMYFSASSSGGTPSFYVEVYKYNGTTFTLLGTSSATPEGITNGTAIDIYYTSVGIPETVLTITDRLAIRVYVTNSGRTITLHTEDNHLSEIVTTFSNGINTLNGLTKQAQYFAVGSTGTDFAIVSSVDTHTFNLPTASASNRGALSSADWTTFNNKAAALSGTINTIAYWNSATTIASLALATYPSLTELSYVKGVTSAIQTQLNAKQATITLTTTGTSGVATFSANTLNIPDYGGALTGYVPYTGANQTLAMGTNNGITLTDTSTNVSISITSSSTGSGAIYVNKSGTGTGIQVANNGTGFGFYANNISTGYGITIGNSSTGKGLYIDNAASATGDPFVYTLGGAAFVKAKIDYLGNITGVAATFTGQLTLGSTITNGTYTYTLPSATGTLALTSALSGYLPLTGGTLTGRLFIDGNLSGNNIVFSKNAHASGYGLLINGGNSSNYALEVGNYLGATILSANTTALTLSVPLSGTSATFSGDLTIDTNTLYVDSTNNRVGIGTTTPGSILDVQQSNATNMGISFMNTFGATSNTAQTVDITSKLVGSGLTGQVGSMIRTGKEGDYSSGAARDAYMSFSVALNDTLTEALRIASTGAATFSSSVTSVGLLLNTGGYLGTRSVRAASDLLIFYGGTSGFNFTDSTNSTVLSSISNSGVAFFSSLGTGTVTATSGVLSTVSDSSYKIDAGFIDSALDKVMNLKPRYFYWNDKSGLPEDVKQLGFYAQEVNEALGEEAANTPATEDIPWGITDRSIIAMLTKAIQELKAEIDLLKSIN